MELTETDREALAEALRTSTTGKWQTLPVPFVEADPMTRDEFLAHAAALAPIVAQVAVRAADEARVKGIRLAIYEGGMWCGECDAADPDDDCCVLPERIRAALTEVRP